MLDNRKFDSLMYEDLGCTAPSDRELRRILFHATKRRNVERNALIFFMQINGFRISETAQVQVKDLMWPCGEWKVYSTLPAKICKNGKPNKIFFINERLREAADTYVDFRIKKRIKLTRNSEFRGLIPHLPLVLAEGHKPFSLKKKIRYSVDGEELIYWSADTLQDRWTDWIKEAELSSRYSSHCGRKANITRYAWHPETSEPTTLAILARHSDNEMPHKYIKESGKAQSVLCDMLDRLAA